MADDSESKSIKIKYLLNINPNGKFGSSLAVLQSTEDTKYGFWSLLLGLHYGFSSTLLQLVWSKSAY